MPTPMRPGLVITPIRAKLAEHTNLSRTLDDSEAFVIRDIRDDQRVCSFSGDEHDYRRHKVMLLFGMPDYYCSDLFEVLAMPDCGHICAPFCSCLAAILSRRGKTLVDRSAPRHTPHSAPRAAPRIRDPSGQSFADYMREERTRMERMRQQQAHANRVVNSWRSSFSVPPVDTATTSPIPPTWRISNNSDD